MARSNLEMPAWPAADNGDGPHPDGILGGLGQEITLSQRRWGEGRRVPLGDPSTMPDIVATPDQVSVAVSRVESLPENLHGWEWSTTHSGRGWSDWATRHSPYESVIESDGDISIHAHVPTRSRQETEINYYPGPLDHNPSKDYGKPSFILTPDRNTLLEFGVRDHAYFVEPVWQRPGTSNSRDYSKWKPTGRDR